jgi:hypothetical protein
MYSLRRKADYELAPDDLWRAKLKDSSAATSLAIEAHRLSRSVPHADFTPIVHLF